MPKTFNYQKAIEMGYSDEEITSHLSEIHPNFNVKKAQQSGYSPQEINEYLANYQEDNPQRSKLEKSGRIAAQFALGAAEGSIPGLVWDVSTSPLRSKEAQNVAYRQEVGEDIERLLEQKSMGFWDQQDQELLDSLQKQIRDPKESEKFVKTADLSIRGLAEQATGLDLHPEGVLEKAAHWTGIIRNPSGFLKVGLKPGEVIKAIAPTGKEILAGVGAGVALQKAEDGEYGPLGTLAAAVVGDIAGRGIASAGKAGINLITKPKKTLAEVAAKFTSKDKLDLQKEIIKEFRDAGIQADLGTITDNNLIKWTQSRLAQSGLTGKALDEFKEQLTNQIKNEYKSLADSLGEIKYSTSHEAGEVAREGIKRIREADLAETRQFYSNAEKALKEKAYVNPRRVSDVVEKLEKELKPGRIKSTEQTAVLNAIDRLKQDFQDSSGSLIYANVKDLMNNKIALNDIINYEVQGGAKQLLKNVVAELDRAIISHGKENPTFAKNYINANKRFAQHAKTFRNKNIDQVLRSADPSQIMNKMKTIQGIKDLENVLSKSKEGREIFEGLKRSKLEDIIGNNLIDSSSKQVKLGTFSKLLEKGKNREIIKEMLGSKEFKKLEKLQKNAGRLADAAQKFYNASKSGVVAADAAILAKALTDIANLLMGNPWPILKTGTTVLSVKQLSKLMADPEFLKMVEEVILASEKGNQQTLFQSIEKLRPYISLATHATNQM